MSRGDKLYDAPASKKVRGEDLEDPEVQVAELKKPSDEPQPTSRQINADLDARYAKRKNIPWHVWNKMPKDQRRAATGGYDED